MQKIKMDVELFMNSMILSKIFDIVIGGDSQKTG